MIAHIGQGVLELVQGDIATQRVDAIVNAANSALAGGGGVDGAIHRGGGPEIMAETRRRYPNGCPTGEAVVSGAGKLPAKFVIHAVGPIYEDGQSGEGELLASAYRASLCAAEQRGCDERRVAGAQHRRVWLSAGRGRPHRDSARPLPISSRTRRRATCASCSLATVRLPRFNPRFANSRQRPDAA